MATILTELGAKSAKGERKVYLVVLKNRNDKKRIPLDISISEQYIKNGKIANPLIATKIEQIRLKYQLKMIDIALFIDGLSAERIAEELKSAVTEDAMKSDNAVPIFSLGFIQYIKKCADKKFDEGRTKTAQGYISTMNAVSEFVKKEFGKEEYDINDIGKTFMLKFVEWNKRRGVSASTAERYVAYMSSIYNQAKFEYNDEDEGINNIPKSPFEKNTAIWRVPAAQRAANVENNLPASTIRYIYNLPDIPDIGSRKNLANLAKDAFLLSFGLCGMNAKDMLEIESLTYGMVKYNRSKTEGRSKFSLTWLEIPDEIRPIHERCANFIPVRGEKRLWYFSQSYNSIDHFNKALNNGLRTLIDFAVGRYAAENKTSIDKAREALRIPNDITFYSARHSWATIAKYDCNIPIDIIDKGLCHAPKSIAETDYVPQGWDDLNKANKKIMEYVFG